MRLDIRLPIGMLCALLGLLLIVSGFVISPESYRASLGININAIWGAVMLLFGVIMLLLGRRGSSGMRPSGESPEGRAIEAKEKRSGLEDSSPVH